MQRPPPPHVANEPSRRASMRQRRAKTRAGESALTKALPTCPGRRAARPPRRRRPWRACHRALSSTSSRAPSAQPSSTRLPGDRKGTGGQIGSLPLRGEPGAQDAHGTSRRDAAGGRGIARREHSAQVGEGGIDGVEAHLGLLDLGGVRDALLVLLGPYGGAVGEGGKDAAQQRGAQLGQLGGELVGRLACDAARGLGAVRPRIDPVPDAHDRHARLLVAREDRPLDGRRAAPARQERGVDVHAAQRRHRENRVGQDAAEGRHAEHVGARRPERLEHLGRDALGLQNGQAERLSRLLDRRGLQALSRASARHRDA